MRTLVIAAALAATLVAGTSTASAETATVSNSGTITIPDKGTASPYASTIDLDGLTGVVTDVYVSLRGVTHTDPSDLDILLESPDGHASAVMSDACGSADVSGRTWTFHMGSPPMPVNAGCPAYFYAPTNETNATDYWPYAPFGVYKADFDKFIGDHPNGDWKLWVVDDTGGDKGKIANGWTLTVETSHPVVSAPAGNRAGPGNPYPRTQTVSAVDGVINRLDVRLDGVYHERAADLDVLLVGPGGQTVMLMSDVCGFGRLKNASFRFTENAISPLTDIYCPDNAAVRPSDREREDLPAPAPPGPYGVLSDFNYLDPNGEWKLYVADDVPYDRDGFITEDFKLDIQTRPRADVYFLDKALDVDEGQAKDLRVFRTSRGMGFGDATVNVTTRPLTAGGADFEPIATTLTMPRHGETTFTVPVKTIADQLPEDVETFEVVLSDPSGDAQLADPITAVVTIKDDDPRPQPGGDAQDPGPVTGSGGADPQPQGGGGVADRIAPVVGRLRIKRRRVRFTLSEAAALTVTVTRGRKTVRTLRLSGRPGRNVVRLGRRRLRRPGRYRVRVVAVDAAGNRSAARTRRLKVGR